MSVVYIAGRARSEGEPLLQAVGHLHDSLLEWDVLDAEHLGRLGPVKDVHVLDELVVRVRLADRDVGQVGETLVQDLPRCQMRLPRAQRA
jgi:hypothetical protein